MQDAETGQRSYIITGDDRFLEPYDDATCDLDRQMQTLAVLFRRHPEQAGDYARLRAA